MSFVIAIAVLDRAIVDEREVRGPAQTELAPDPRLEHARRALERARASRRAAFSLP